MTTSSNGEHAGDPTERRLLQSIVEAARRIFSAAASSVFLVDPDDGSLVFEAVAGEGERHLLGRSFPPGTGIAGWVAASGQTMVVDDVSSAAMFAQDAAESTGYVPDSVMAAPLLSGDECIGVIEVLDATHGADGSLDAVDLLSVFATQASCGLELLLRVRRTESASRSPEVIAQDIVGKLRERGLPADHPASTLLSVVDELVALSR